ncbi:ABC transporter ATP-binding protein [Rhizobacter sp. OV335]|uniref:ABC transporter ATP-binding protein n=1 Tax=Rhizobacter sp. OV335 TaxID=1500264 RepID=UPI000910A599|nr:ABC transporter ATP-binding protein [Rhizobacter sp. OV335]SHL92152.1 NitT/TauT family transport system ATP-binding protein [Rhizobacter sp. OV335]
MSDASDALVSLQQVDKRFANGVQALQAVTLDVQPGEFVSLLGPSGCGKSTVLRLVAGLDRASAGTVRAPALQVNVASDTAFVFQEPTLMPWASVFDNAWLPLRLAGVSRRYAAARVMPLLQRMGLEAFADAFPAELSGGMKMRASIARALVTQPQLLLMDEPFAALDEITRQRLNADLMEAWQARPMAVLFVTHSVLEAVALSQRVLVMGARPGRIVAEFRIRRPARHEAGFRDSDDYVAQCRAVSRSLEAAHAAAAA